MRRYLPFAFLLIFFTSAINGQEAFYTASTSIQNLLEASLDAKEVLINLADPDELDLAIKKIHTYKNLERIVLEGEGAEEKLKKLIFRLSVLKRLSQLSLIDNGLLQMPDNIGLIKSLQTLSIEGNPDLDYDQLLVRLKMLTLQELVLNDNELKKTPIGISQLKNLKKFQLSGSNTVDYNALIKELAKLPGLTTLAIPVNYITELPPNLDLLKSLQVLDVSENNLIELPPELSALKSINNLSIQGNLLLDPLKDLSLLKGNNIQFLSLDKEISGEEIEQIKKMFPNAELSFPLNKKQEPVSDTSKINQPVPEQHQGALRAKKELRLLSGAYALYAAFFQGLLYTLDTLSFDERYADLRYSNVYEYSNFGFWRAGSFSFRTWLASGERGGKRRETWFRMPLNDQVTNRNYSELRAFSGMYWVYQGPLTKKKFKKTYIRKKQKIDVYNRFLGSRKRNRKMPILWNDIRIDFDSNNSLFGITLKNDSGFVKIQAYPVFPDYTLEKSQEVYHRRFLLYKKSLLRRKETFSRNLAKNKRNYDFNYRKMQDYAWKELQLRMCDEERAMSREDWLLYYDEVIANEQQALDNSSLSAPYILRDLQIRNYMTGFTNRGVRNLQLAANGENIYGLKNLNVDFIDSKSGNKLAVASVYVVDNDKKIIAQYSGTLGLYPTTIALRQYSNFTILVEIRNGNWASVNAEEIDRLNIVPGANYQIKAQVFDKNLDNIGALLQSGLK